MICLVTRINHAYINKAGKLVCFIQYKNGNKKIVDADKFTDESGNLLSSVKKTYDEFISSIVLKFPDKSFLPSIFSEDMYLDTDDGICQIVPVSLQQKYGGTLFLRCHYESAAGTRAKNVALELICNKDGVQLWDKDRLHQIQAAILPHKIYLLNH